VYYVGSSQHTKEDIYLFFISPNKIYWSENAKKNGP